MKKSIALLLAFVLVISVFAGCNGNAPTDPTDPSTPAASGTTPDSQQQTNPPAESETALKLHWQQAIGIDTLFENPHHDEQSLWPSMVFEPLAYYDAGNNELIPALATEWTNNADYTEWTITVREGVQWHDGEPLTVEDVYWSLQDATCNPNTRGFNFCNYIVGHQDFKDGKTDKLEGITIEDGKVVVRLSQPTALFAYSLLGVYVLPSHLLGDLAWADVDSNDFWKKPIGTGPYVIDKVSFPDYFTVTRNDNYWGEPAGIKNVQFTSYATGGNDAAVAAVIAGELDVAPRQIISDKGVADNIVAQNADVKSLMISAFATRTFVFNLGERADGNVKEDLKNAKVRQAISLLVDEDTIASFYMGQATPAKTLVHTNGTEYNTDIPTVSKDVEAAKKLLDEAGFDYSQTIDLAYYYDDQTTADVMQLITQDFAEAGVKLNAFLLTGDLSAAIYTDCNYDIIYVAGSSTANNQANFYSQSTSVTAYTFMGQFEERGEIFDDLMNQYNGTADVTERKEISWKLQAAGYENCYMFALYFMNNCVCYNTKRVEIPEEIYSVDGNTYMRWSEWKILN